MAVAGALSPTRAIRQSRRIDARVPVSILILLAAIGGALVFFSANNDTRGVLVATHDLPAGATLTSGDLAIARVRVDDSLYQAAIQQASLSQIVGKQLAEPVHAQQLLVPAQVSSRPVIGPNDVAMTIPVGPSSAVGGRIRAGDSVRVIATLNKQKPDAKTSVVLDRARVYDVGYAQGVTSVTGAAPADPARTGQIAWITMLLGADDAVKLSEARWNGDLDVVLLPPDPQPQSNG